MSLLLHDTHFHLDLFDNAKDIVHEIEAEQIYTIAVTNVPDVFVNTQSLVAECKFIRPALGFHPELVYQFQNQLHTFLTKLPETRYIGEIGLDNFKKSSDDFAVQKKVFEKIINVCSDAGNKVLTIHSRRAEKEVISIIGNSFKGKVILHWYSGNLSEMERALGFGFYFSVNLAMTNSDNGKKIIERIPKDRLLLETDGPFISAENTPSKPYIVKETLKRVTQIKGGSDLTEHLVRNFRTLLSE